MNRTFPLYAKIAVSILSVIIIVRLFLMWIPYPDLKRFLNRQYSLQIHDRNGELLEIVPLEDGIRREYTPLKDIPVFIQQVFIKSEDRRFYYHPGIDPIALIRSVFRNLTAGRILTGGSTITMQLARIVSPRASSIPGKVVEMLNALRIEAKLHKRQILELYLNSIPFAYRAEGVTSAGRTFFGQSLPELSPAQVILLAVIPRRPQKYNPVESPEAAFAAASELSLSKRFGITPAEIEEGVLSAQYGRWGYKAPHFLQFLKERAGFNELSGRKGGSLSTSLDLDLNLYLEERLNYYLDKYSTSRLTNGAGILIDNQSGEILAYVGSRNFFGDDDSGQIDGVQVANQSGSCIKPFLYAYALEHGFTPNTVLPDIPLEFGSSQVYLPQNFNKRYNGPVRLRVALASSLNVPAVYLLHQIGVTKFFDFLLSLGFESLKSQANTAGLGLAVGNGEVSLYELARAFALFPRRGLPLELTPFKLEHPPFGSYQVERKPIISDYAADLICDILSDKASRILGFGETSVLNVDFSAMFKTGTANQFQHIWALGATPDYTIGIWMGNFSGDTVIGKTGSSIPAQIAVEM
ncbi:MAG: transglycosylase domain-containing protein, partial [Spirochaetota bacterium]